MNLAIVFENYLLTETGTLAIFAADFATYISSRSTGY